MKFSWTAILFFILGSISGCTSLPTATANPVINRERAIEIATGGCKIPHLVLISEPTNIRTKFITLEEASKLTGVEGEFTNYVLPMDTMVWLVQMDGKLQIVGGPPTEIPKDSQAVTSTPPQPFWGTCTVILNATSGDVISVRG